MNHKWSTADETYIRKQWRKLSDRLMAQHLGVTTSQVGSRRTKMGLYRDPHRGSPRNSDDKYFDFRSRDNWFVGPLMD